MTWRCVLAYFLFLLALQRWTVRVTFLHLCELDAFQKDYIGELGRGVCLLSLIRGKESLFLLR